jgi:multidrug efflux pump subunit AcrB
MNRMIAWFATNSVAANLLVILILVGGLLSLGQIRREVFPEFASDRISVSVIYPGAAPEEVEEGVCVRVEEAIQSLEGIRQLVSTATEGVGVVVAELLPNTDARKLLDDIKARVDAIETFPAEAEKPVVQEMVIRKQVLNVAISGNAPKAALKRLAERVRDEIISIPGITQVEVASAPPYEISVHVSEEALRRHGITFEDVAGAIRRSSLDLPGGALKTSTGEILLRSRGQAYSGEEFALLPVLTRPDGTRLLVGDLGEVVDGFAETDQEARFDGESSVLLQVFRVGEESALEISEKVKDYVSGAQERMPGGIQITTWQDDSDYLKSRIELLVRNARAGLVLVFIILAMFLRFRLAAWVSFGIAVSFLGTFWLMPVMDVSINLMSLFAFILVLGIVVDDAIVVSENVYTQQQQSGEGLRGAIEGCKEVATPVIFSVLTTIAAFLPMLTVPGNTGKVMKVIPLIVIATLVFSLIESLLVLPAHLSGMRKERERRGVRGAWVRFQGGFSRGVQRFAREVYRPALERCLEWRYLTMAAALALLLFTVGMVFGGRISYMFLPPVEGDNVAAMVTLPQGTPVEVTAEAVRHLEASALELQRQIDIETGGNGKQFFRHVLASVGEQPFLTAQRHGAGRIVSAITGSHLGEVHIELAPSEERLGTSTELANRWRELTGAIPDAVELTFTSSIFSAGEPINIQLSGPNMEQLRRAAEELKEALSFYPGTLDVADSFRAGKQEILLSVRPEAEAMGISLENLARQVRQAFYGEEAQRIQRGRDEVKVMVRYPPEQRRSLGDLEEMRIRTPEGEAPFSAVAEAELGRGYASIKRVDRNRAINVTSDVDQSRGDANAILKDLELNFLPGLLERYPGLTYAFEGEQREQAETMGGLGRSFVLALILIYALLAIPFRSYVQPLIILSAIPFGIVGAVWGHVLMGMELTVLSTFGIVALSGVVVNASLVLVHFINQARREGSSLAEAVRTVGMARFRPIVITSLTTFAGLTPLMLERSVQAQFLIPMAVSLAFGVLFSTIVTLILVPSMYLILEDLKLVIARRHSQVEDGPGYPIQSAGSAE